MKNLSFLGLLGFAFALASTGSASAGPFVSGGIGDNSLLVDCSGDGAFAIHATPVPNVFRGDFEDRNTRDLKMDCVKLGLKVDGSQWTCKEARPGEGQLTALVYENSQGVRMVQIGRLDMIGRIQPIKSLLCK